VRKTRRQRPAVSPICCPAWLGRQVHRPSPRWKQLRRALDGQDLDQGVRDRSDGPTRGWIAPAAAWSRTHGIPVVILFRKSNSTRKNPRPRRQAGEGTRYWHRGGVGRLPLPGRRFLAEQGTRDAFGHAQTGRRCPVVANMIKDAARPQVPLAVADYLQRACAPHRIEDRRPSRPTSWARAVELAIKGHNSVMPTSTACRIRRTSTRSHGRPEGCRKRREVHAARFHHQGRLRHHRQVQALSDAADSGEDYPKYKDGLPVYVTLKNVAVAKSWRRSNSDRIRIQGPGVRDVRACAAHKSGRGLWSARS